MTDPRSEPLPLYDLRRLHDALAARIDDRFWSAYLGSAFARSEPRPGLHLAVFTDPLLTLLLDRKKTVESRFSVNRCAPYEQVDRGDIVLLKRSSGPVVGLAIADEPAFYELGPSAWAEVHKRFSRATCAPQSFWESKRDARYGTLIPIRDVIAVSHVALNKRDRRGWVVLDRAIGQIECGPTEQLSLGGAL